MTYSIIVWHHSPVRGTHQTVLFSAATQAKVLRDYDRYMTLPRHCRVIGPKTRVQLRHVQRGVIAELIPSN